jgi:hypothetical protein
MGIHSPGEIALGVIKSSTVLLKLLEINVFYPLRGEYIVAKSQEYYGGVIEFGRRAITQLYLL